MNQAINEVERANNVLAKDIWSPDIKASDDALDPIFRRFYELVEKPLLFRKADYHALVRYIPVHEIDPEVVEKLDAIARVAGAAAPRSA